MIELNWEGHYLTAHGWDKVPSGLIVARAMQTQGGKFIVVLGATISARAHPYESRLYDTVDEAQQAIEDIAWVAIIGGDHG